MTIRVKRSHYWRAGALLLGMALVTGCDRGVDTEPATNEPVAIEIGPENVAFVTIDEIRTGPIVSGSLMPERQATVRAEVGGSILSTTVDEGQSVGKGALLARIEARDLMDTKLSAQSAVRSAEIALQVASSEAQRTETLVKGGALAQRDLETAQTAVAGAEAQLAAARARLASADQQLADTIIRAPIGGVVSDRAVSSGDVVTAGTPLFTVIDPSSMRLEASVPSDELSLLRVGAQVVFNVRGYPGQTFEGKIERISPSADPITRQVSILVSLPNTSGRLIGGLFAEGRVTTQVKRGLVIPAAAVDTTMGTPTVTRITNGRAERVQITVGLRDDKTERVEVVAGLEEGDGLLVGASQSITPGTPVRLPASIQNDKP